LGYPINIYLLLEFLNLFCAGLLAGAEYTVRFGVRAPITILDERPQVELRQALIRRLRVLVPAVYVPTALSAVAVMVLAGSGAGFGFRCVGLLAVLLWTATTFLGTVPINADMLTWRPEAPPAQWKAIIGKWERLDTIRFWAAVVAFAFFLTAAALRLAGMQLTV
jgi:hypothetical protein